ncbi:MAG TPA: hypothetical protein VHE79_11915 [Spirochaetia bacterium]
MYRISLAGDLDPRWSDWFENMAVTRRRGRDGSIVTLVTGLLQDQAALRGVLTRMWDLNLQVLSVRQVRLRGAGG